MTRPNIVFHILATQVAKVFTVYIHCVNLRISHILHRVYIPHGTGGKDLIRSSSQTPRSLQKDFQEALLWHCLKIVKFKKAPEIIHLAQIITNKNMLLLASLSLKLVQQKKELLHLYISHLKVPTRLALPDRFKRDYASCIHYVFIGHTCGTMSLIFIIKK